MLLALAADVPLICYWDEKLWLMGPETEERLKPLRASGILQPNALSAADMVGLVWPDVAGWWQSRAAREARRQWVEVYAACPARSPLDLTLRWLRILRGL
jgi:putative transferase (TIGR04331 family)